MGISKEEAIKECEERLPKIIRNILCNWHKQRGMGRRRG